MHLGAEAITAERLKMLCQFDIAKTQISDDPVKVDHGKVAESIFREYLSSFLPKKYGVCKGYIISREPKSSVPLDEWDIIIYDTLNSPVLFVRSVDGEKRQGIPIEYVKAVIEVKASLNQVSARKAKDKLLKLKSLTSKETDKKNQLHADFFAIPLFFETDTKSKHDYKNCLNQINELACELNGHFEFSLILRSQKKPALSTNIYQIVCEGLDPQDIHPSNCEFSDPIDKNEMHWFSMSPGFGENIFPNTMMYLIDRLNEGSVYGDYMVNFHNGYGTQASDDNLEPLW